MHFLAFAFLTSLIITAVTIPSIIRLASARGWLDSPSERKIHQQQTPLLGGVGIFAGLVMALVLWMPEANYPDTRYLFASLLILFMIGIKDDLYPLSPGKKLIAQTAAAGLLVFGTGAIIPSFFGIFGWYDLSWWFSRLFSVLTLLVIINGFNLIDGINGLAGSVGTLASLFFAGYFSLVDQPYLAVLSVSLAGSLLAFLYFNFSSRIFMGDTGSLVIGMVIGMLTAHFLQLHHTISDISGATLYLFDAVPAVATGLLILPLFDTIRVFVLRVLKGRNPLAPDRMHLHHMLVDLGFNHGHATLCLICANLCFLAFVILFQSLDILLLLLLLFGFASIASGGLNYAVVKRRANLKGGMV